VVIKELCRTGVSTQKILINLKINIILRQDWSKDSLSLNTSPIFSTNSITGLGGFGDPLQDYQITTGGFSNMSVAYPMYVHMHKRVSPASDPALCAT
jgi:hypothetical protein